jgi:hypothetical protein
MGKTSYDADFYGWANEQAALLRAGRLGEADVANIAEEIESMGRSEKRELVSRLAVLLTHLLKWRYQPTRRSKSWSTSVRVQRQRLARHLEDNPSLRPMLPKALADAYADALLVAADETGLAEESFPSASPFDIGEILNADFWPE